MNWELKIGDCLERLKTLPAGSVQTCVTSPPYWGLRDYKIKSSIWDDTSGCIHEWEEEIISTEIGKGNWSQGVNGRGERQPGGVDEKREPIRSQISRGFCKKCHAWLGVLGLEPTAELFVSHIVYVFSKVKNALANNGTLWLNLGDSYAQNNGSKTFSPGDKQASNAGSIHDMVRKPKQSGLKPKDLVGVPWKVAFALQADGWYLRQDIIWSKPNPMPESITDRCTKAHEYIFLLSKSQRYYYDSQAIREKAVGNEIANGFRGGAYTQGETFDNDNGGKRKTRGNKKVPAGWDTGPGGHNKLIGRYENAKDLPEGQSNIRQTRDRQRGKARPFGAKNQEGTNRRDQGNMFLDNGYRNKRSVWTVSAKPFKEAHFATFPLDLIKPCILAGAPKEGLVLDPFAGSGTTGVAALQCGRRFVGIELNPEYAKMAQRRLTEADAQTLLPLD